MSGFLAALRFLTILPLPGSWGTREQDLARSALFFPLVGLLLGVVSLGLGSGLAELWPQGLTSALMVVLMVGFSGGLHLDGLADTADGFWSGRPRERMLEIMKDSHIGSMGALAIAAILLLKATALASLNPRVWPWALLLMPLAGRVALVVPLSLLNCARPGGLANIFFRNKPLGALALGLGLLAGIGWLSLGGLGLVVTTICLGVALLGCGYSWVKIGGATGDTLGAVCEMVELVPALVLALKPLQELR